MKVESARALAPVIASIPVVIALGYGARQFGQWSGAVVLGYSGAVVCLVMLMRKVYVILRHVLKT